MDGMGVTLLRSLRAGADLTRTIGHANAKIMATEPPQAIIKLGRHKETSERASALYSEDASMKVLPGRRLNLRVEKGASE